MRVSRKLLICGLFIVLASGGWLYYYATTPVYFVPAVQSVLIEPGQTAGQVINTLAQRKLLTQPFWFVQLVRMMGKGSKIKAGSYEFHSPLTPWQLLQKITDGDVESSVATIIEGWRWQDIRRVLNQDPNLRHETANMSDAEIVTALGISENHLEGAFFPDTYHYTKGSSDLDLLKRAYQLMQRHLDQAWQARTPDVPLTSPYELLVMASLVEKETGKASDRELIAGVFANRLRIGMRLQTDPSVIYGMGENYKGAVRKVDLLKDTPYNTYTRAGLPPSPIAMPGRAALFAAAQPAKTRALYFVAKGDGSSHFSETLLEHNRAVNTYIRGVNR